MEDQHSQAYNLLIRPKPVIKDESLYDHRKHYTDERKQIATANDSFKSLLPYPCLLAWWSGKHTHSSKLIGKFVSHIYRYHVSCGKDCATIERMTRKALIERIYFTLQLHKQTLQPSLIDY